MKSIDSGKEKVKKICDILRKETLEPAKEEGKAIVSKARQEGEKIIQEAKEEAARLLAEAKQLIEEERNVFRSSLHLASKKVLDTLKQRIEEKLFHPELSRLVRDTVHHPKVVAKLIDAMVCGIKKEGIYGDLKAIISSRLKVETVNRNLTKEILDALKSNSVEIGEIEGGAQLKIVDDHLTIDVSDKALTQFVAAFVSEEFRSLIFASTV